MSPHLPPKIEDIMSAYVPRLAASAALVPFAPRTTILLLAALLVLAYIAYHHLLPTPLPNIAHNPASARSPLGDLPHLLAAFRTGDARSYLNGLASTHKAPLVQIFTRGRLPTLILSDYRAAQELLLRRNREFERPTFIREALRAFIPHHHIGMLTVDPTFRKNRELVRDLMGIEVLHGVNAPRIWGNAGGLVELWRVKMRLAGGRCFDAREDVVRLAFDVVKEAALGKSGSSLVEKHLEILRSEYGDASGGVEQSRDEAPFVFPAPPMDEVLEAQNRMNAAITQTGAVPFFPARWFHAVNNLRPSMRQAFLWKEEMLRRQVELAVKRMEAGEPLESALDYMIQRELSAAKKEHRAPVFESPTMYDELYGYIGAGHDTTATTFSWGLKHLTQEPLAQFKARQNLRAVYATAHAQRRQPSIAEILTTRAPYLDAVIEEVLRLSAPVPAIARTATVDTTILGRAVPRGTTVFLSGWGAGFTAPSVADGLVVARGEKGDAGSAAPSYTKRLNWDGMEPERFVPERWLVREEGGGGSGGGDGGGWVFDAQAGPMLAFSLGIRGCFGKRLAYLTLRTLFTLVLWNFELRSVPAAVDGWEAETVLTRKPVQFFVRLAEAPE